MQINKETFPSSLVEELAGLHAASDRRNAGIRNISISCYENEVPSHIEQTLADLYGNIFSSLAHLELHGSTFGASTYIASKDNKFICVLLFEHNKNEVRVINEGMTVSQEEIDRFSRFIFATYQSIKKISFNAICTETEKSSFVTARFPVSENIILSLPSTEGEYVAKLGKSTRKNIKHHLSRLKRSFPSFQHQVVETEAVRDEDILTVIEFNKKRMTGKHKVSHLDEEKTKRIIELVKRSGFVSLIKIDGRVCAGAICYRVGATVTSHVNAHDPQFDEFRLGTLCCFLAICESIRKEAKEFHFLWGRYEYKYALLGVEHTLNRVFVYRSFLNYLADAKTLCRHGVNWQMHKLKSWVTGKAKNDTAAGRLTKKTLQLVKR